MPSKRKRVTRWDITVMGADLWWIHGFRRWLPCAERAGHGASSHAHARTRRQALRIAYRALALLPLGSEVTLIYWSRRGGREFALVREAAR